MTPTQAWTDLSREMKELAVLRSAAGLLSWDEQTHLPPGGAAWRAEQLGYFSRITHERFTSKSMGELVDTLAQHPDARVPDSDIGTTARELKKAYTRATKLPTDLVEEMAKHDVLAQQAWVEARKKSDFASFAPWLTKTFDLKRREAQCVGFKAHIYDALLDDYEPGETYASVKPVLEGLREPLVKLVQQVKAAGKTIPQIKGPFPIPAQESFGLQAAAKMGYDFNAGRLDVSVHPFCTGMAPGDTRITTRYREDDMADALFGVLHEVGHALYEQGLPKAQFPGLPLAEAVSLGIHESQSRMWENLVGRSRAFWTHFGPSARDKLTALRDLPEATLMSVINEVSPGFIRVESDEVTYNLHIMIRFELESAMLAGELKIADLPEAWNAKVKSYLGLDVPNAAQGCLQDIHWSAGLVGYFPTYTLGNLYAAQFFNEARKDLGDLDAMFAKGEFTPLLEWLRKHIHRHGRRYSASQLCERITGAPLSNKALLAHLASKVNEYYG